MENLIREKIKETIKLEKRNVVYVMACNKETNKVEGFEEYLCDTLDNTLEMFYRSIDTFNKLGYERCPTDYVNVVEFENSRSYIQMVYFK